LLEVRDRNGELIEKVYLELLEKCCDTRKKGFHVSTATLEPTPAKVRKYDMRHVWRIHAFTTRLPTSRLGVAKKNEIPSVRSWGIDVDETRWRRSVGCQETDGGIELSDNVMRPVVVESRSSWKGTIQQDEMAQIWCSKCLWKYETVTAVEHRVDVQVFQDREFLVDAVDQL